MSFIKRRVGVVLAVAIVAVVVASTALAEQSFTDPVGDAGAAADIISARVGNDSAGLITVEIATAAPLSGTQEIWLLLDTDKNAATGDQGDDHWLFAYQGGGGIDSWDGAKWAAANPASFSLTTLPGNVTKFTINRTDIGNTAGFTFAVGGLHFTGDDLDAVDVLPDGGQLTYDLVYPQCANKRDDDGDGKVDGQDLGCSSGTDDNEADDPVNIRLGTAKTTPAHPKAGSVAVISMPTTRVETGKPLTSGKVSCTARFNGTTVRGTGSLVAGRATCKVKLPKTATNKVVRGTVAVVFKTAVAQKPFSFRTAA